MRKKDRTDASSKQMWRLIGAVLLLIGTLVTPVSAEHGPITDVSCPIPGAQVVLDRGHGGEDPGAVNEAFELREAELNLEIARRVAQILQVEHGLSVALTRVDNATALGNSERGAIANACAATVYVSIHLNGTEDPGVDYAQSFWAEKEKDLALSLVMNSSLASLGIPVNIVDRFDNGGLLRARMPSVLVEAVFLSNPDEAEALKKQLRQDEIAQAIAAGIVMWFDLW